DALGVPALSVGEAAGVLSPEPDGVAVSVVPLLGVGVSAAVVGALSPPPPPAARSGSSSATTTSSPSGQGMRLGIGSLLLAIDRPHTYPSVTCVRIVCQAR